jgi:hypothetical protein
MGKSISDLVASGLPLAPEADPKGKGDELYIQPERLVADVQEVMAELLPGRDVLGSVNRRETGQAGPAILCRGAEKPEGRGEISPASQHPRTPAHKGGPRSSSRRGRC